MDKIEFKKINPYEKGETWAIEFNQKDAVGVEIYINGKEVNEIFGIKRSHLSPHILLTELLMAQEKADAWWDGSAAIGGCYDCGDEECDWIRTTIVRKPNDNVYYWMVFYKGMDIKEGQQFVFDVADYNKAMETLKTFSEEA